jgi:high-affinity K+ transport system ATPase subunit B
MKQLLILSTLMFFGSLASAEVANDPNEILLEIAGKIKHCNVYSLNSGKSNPYEEVCVQRLVEATELAAILVNTKEAKSFATIIKNIKNCHVYILNGGTNMPYEEGCVNNLLNSAQEVLSEKFRLEKN